MTVSPEVHYQKSWAGKIGAATTRSRHSPTTYTFAGRNAFLRSFLPADPSLTAEEAERRAKAALKAHMLKLALRSAKARRGKKVTGR